MQKDGISYSTDKQTNRITTAGYQYDVAGNQTRALAEDGVTWLKYEYDAANRLQVIKKDDGSVNGINWQAFQFGSSNQRLMDLDYQYGYLKIIGGGGAIEYTEFAGAVPTWTKSYVRLGGSILSTITPNGSGGETTEFNHPGRLGISLTTNQQSGTFSEQNSLPFGTALASETTPNNNTKKFTSYERSARTGLDYAINRTYDSKLGRFTQVDPIKMSAVSLVAPQTLNLYSYCGNDPINHTDANGLFWGFFKKLWNVIKVVIAIVVAVIAVIAAIVITAGAAGVVFASGFASAGAAIGASTGAIGSILAIAGAASQVYRAVGAVNNLLSFNDIPPRSGPCKLTTPTFDTLKGLGGAAFKLLTDTFGDKAKSTYDGWGTYNQAVYLNTIEAVAAQGVDLSTAKMTEFYKGNDPKNLSADPYGVTVSGVTTANLDRSGLGGSRIPGVGRRSPKKIETASIEATVHGDNVAFDIDLYNVKSGLKNVGKHKEEVDFNNKNKTTTHPADVLRGLNGRGVVTSAGCK
jgi:RHS repeat-associated protein